MSNKETNKKKVLYDELVNDGYDLGTFESFSENVNDEKKRKTLYETITKDNWDVGDYDSFSKALLGSHQSAVTEPVQGSNPLEQPLHIEVPESIRSSYSQRTETQDSNPYTLPQDFKPKTAQDSLNKLPDSGYQPTEEEVKKHILDNKPSMFVNRTSNLIDKSLGDAGADPELYGNKFDARIDAVSRYYKSDAFKNQVKRETGEQVASLLEQTSKDLGEIDKQIDAREDALRNPDWKPGMPSSRDDDTLAGLRGQRAYLKTAENLLDDSRKIVEEAGKKDSPWYKSLGRGVADKAFDVDSWTMGITDMAGSMNLNKVLEKADKEEELTPAEQRLLDAAVTNMAVNAYYSSDLSAAYKAGQATGESLPFMLEMAINPISASGNSTAKILLKYGLKKMGKQLGKNIGKTIGAAAGMTATTGLPSVIGGGYDRMNGQVQFGLDGNGQLSYAGRKGAMGGAEAFGKSAASRFLENHSEMVFNAFKGMGDIVWRGVEKAVPGGVNSFIQKAADTGAGRMLREWGNNELMKEVAKRTQFHGIVGEFGEEVYNNLANVPLGEMTMEQVADLDRNIDTFLGLAPTSVFFGLLGLGSLTAERIQHRRKMDAAFGNMNDVQRKKFAELERMSKQNGNADIRTFIKETMADLSLSKEQKRQEIEYAYDIAVNNAYDEVADEQTKEQGETRVVAQEEGKAVYESGDPAAIRESVVREEVSRGRLEEVYPDVETIAKLMQADDANRAEILDEMPEDVRDRAKIFLRDYDRHQSVEAAMDEAHVPEVETAQSRVEEMTRHGRVTVIPLGRFADETHKYGVVISGLDEVGNNTVNGNLVMVVPLEGVNAPDFSTFDTMNAEAIAIDSSVKRQEMEPDSVVESMLGAYQADVDKLSQAPVAVGQSYTVVDASGQPKNIEIQGKDAQGNWIIAVEGQKNPAVIPEENLFEMLAEAERASVVAEYDAEEQAKADAKSAAQKEIMSDEFSPEVMALQPEPGEEIEVNGRRASVMGVTPDGVNVRYLSESGMTVGSGVISMEDYYTHKQVLFNSSQAKQEYAQEEQASSGETEKPMSEDEAASFIFQMERNAVEAPDIALTPENWIAEFGEDGIVDTPLGKVRFGEHQYLKLQQQGRNSKLGMIKPTLSNPDVIVQTASQAKKDDVSERDTSYIFVKSFKGKDGQRIYYFTSVTVRKNGVEVVVSNQEKKKNRILRLLQEGNVVWRTPKDATTSSAERQGLYYVQSNEAETATKGSGITPQTTSSFNKGKEEKVQSQENQNDFVSMGKEKALKMLGEKYGEKMPHKVSVTAEAYKADLEKMQKKLDKAAEDYDNVPIGREEKAEAALKKVSQEYEALKLEADFWSALDAEIKAAQKKPGEAVAEEIMSMEEPLSGEEFAAQMLASGVIKLLRDSFVDETGFSNGEAKSYIGLFASAEKGGVSIERAGELLMQYDREEGTNYFDQTDPNAGRNAIIEVLSAAKTRGELASYIKRNRQELAQKEQEAEYAAYESWVEENFHMSVEDFESYEEVIARDLAERALTDAEYKEFMSIFVDETTNNELYEQQGIDSESTTGSEVLPETQSLQTERDGGAEKESSEVNGNIVGQNGAVSEGTSGSELVSRIEVARSEVNVNPSEAQKEAGNYKMGHVRIDGYDISIENPKGSVRSGVDKDGKSWSIVMNNDYGYIRGTEAVDGDHIDVFLSDTPDSGRVFVVDQKNKDGAFDESKVMYGFNSMEEARAAYLSNYGKGWENRIMAITEVSKEDFKEWIGSSRRKTKAFSEYKSVKQESNKSAVNPLAMREGETGYEYALRMAEEKHRAPLRSRANDWAKVLGVKVNFIEKKEDVKNKTVLAALEKGQKVTGWFELGNGEVYFYMPNLDNMGEVDNTYVHEVVSHKGLPQLLGKKRFDELCDKVWDMMPQSVKDEFISYPGVNGNTRIAADEYIAHLAEQESLSPEEKSVWDEIVKLVRDMLDKVLNGIVGKPVITDKDISKLIKASYANLKFGAAKNVEGESTRLRTSREIEKLFDNAVAGNLTGKPVSIGKLTSEGKDYLERISGLKLKSDIDFVLNPSDLVHIYRDHYETNEKDTGKNVPLTKNDIRRLVDVVSFPNKVVFGIEEGSNRKLFYFLMDSAGGTYNLLEVYADRKGNLTTKTYYKTKKDAAQRVMELENSLLPTSETYSGAILSDTKIPKIFEPTNDSNEKSRFRVVFHGSGAEFDKFDHAKMGTGAGSQVFGWGTYVTESEQIGRDYANIGRKATDDDIKYIGDFGEYVGNDIITTAKSFLRDADYNLDKAKELVNDYLSKNVPELTRKGGEFLLGTNENDWTYNLKRHFYEVEIPDEKRGNYIVWGNNVTDAAAKKVFDGIYNRLVATEEYDNATAKKEFRRELDDLKSGYGQGQSGVWKDLYGDVSSYLGSDKEASLFLRSLGYVGIKYPAGTIYQGNYGGAHNYVIFDENDLQIVEHTRFRVYKSKDGKETKYKQLSLFDEGIKSVNDGGGSNNIQRKGTSTIESLNRLRELQEGEICNVERRFTESKEFSFTRGEKVESTADVAYIFKSLEDEAIENSFVAIANGDNVTVVHLGMGAQSQTVVDTSAIIAAVERLNADKVFFVHNHPSGEVKCSRQDVLTYKSLKNVLGDRLEDGIIINTRSGKYGLFNSDGLVDDDGRITSGKTEYPIKVYKFNKQAFNVDVIPTVTPSSAGIAEFVSTQRLGHRDKINALLLNNQFGCVGNILIDNSKNMSYITERITNDAIAMGARQVVIYGRYPFVEVTNSKTNFAAYLSKMINEYSQGNVNLIDIIQIDESYSKSANDEGVRFRVANRNQEIFVSNAQKAVEGIKQEKGTPQQWLAMIEKNGGLKAGEDKWLGLSDWLKASDAKTLTKDEVLNFINQNKIVIEEVNYSDSANNANFESLKEEYDQWLHEEGSDYAWNELVERYGDAAEKAFSDLGGELVIENEDVAATLLGSDNIINSTRLEYTTEGLENKQEIALTIPTIEPWNESDEVHFGDVGEGRAVVWMRFGETRGAVKESDAVDKYLAEMRSKYNAVEGEETDYMTEDEIKHLQALTSSEMEAKDNAPRVLVIDEIQSKRHQEGREKGYVDTKAIKKEIKRLEEERDSLDDENRELRKTLNEKYDYKWTKLEEWTDSRGMVNQRLAADKDILTAEEYEKVTSMPLRMKELDEQLANVKRGADDFYKVPFAPFEKNWSELAMKRMLRYAAENGFDKVAWTKGIQQAQRYSLGNVVDSVSISKSTKEEGKYHITSWDKDTMPIGIASGNKTAEELRGLFGKAVADELINGVENLEEGSDTFVLEGANLEVGGEGMKGFYDKMLPSFVNKYVKKWGTKVQDIELPNVEEAGRIMHSVDVTEAMKESVMQGQTMFRIKREDAQKQVDEFSSKYNSKPVSVVSSEMTDEELEKAVPTLSSEDARKRIYEGLIGGYSPKAKKIYIFADNVTEEDFEDTLFHENLHQIFSGNPMIEEFYNGFNNKYPEQVKGLTEGYKEADLPEEVFVITMAHAMASGRFDVVNRFLSEESKNELLNTLKDFGYDYEQERGRRIDGRADVQAEEGRSEVVRMEEMDKGSGSTEGSEGQGGSSREQAEQLGKLFGQVADMGLRSVLGDVEYDSLMRDVYNVLPKEVRSVIMADAQKRYNGNFVPAMSDYLNIKGKASVWDKIVGKVKEYLRRVGFDLSLTENDVKYLIWRNKKPLNPYSIIEKAEDINKQVVLKVGAYSDESSGVRFREKRPAIVQEYDKAVDSNSFRFQEAFQDSMLSLKVLMEIIEKETGKKAKSFENAYTAENRLSSINKIDNEKYLELFFNPLMAEIKVLSDKVGQQAVEDYIYAKSGLERNEVLKQRDADKAYAESIEELDEKLRKGELSDDQYDALKTNAEIARSEAMAKEDDYAGLRGLLFNFRVRELDDRLERSEITIDEYDLLFAKLEENADDVEKGFKEFAERIVSDFEAEVGEDAVNSLWGKINASTNETLRKDYESGMMDKETFEGTKGMMKYYIPLRGWSEKTAEDVYDYYHTSSPIQKNQKTAKGRHSQADNPIASIAQMAQNAIVRGNRNKMKQRLFNFVVNRPTALATFQEGWYVKNLSSQAFEVEFPEIEEGDTAEDIQRKMEEFEKRMEELSKDKLAFKGKLPFGSPYRIKAKQKNEHVVPVMINGREYGIYINGNPRAAQAVNGMTNPEATNMMSEMYETVKRFYAAGLTSWNPDFLMANVVRDSIHSVTMTYLDKGPLAAAYYLKSIPNSLRTVAAEVFGKGISDPVMHRYFEEFVNYGGETGYTAIHTLEDYKKEYEKAFKDLSSLEAAVHNVKGGFSAMAKWMEQANRIFEDVNRFNAYQAARRSGLGIEESVDAAKNITVNFNKKGALGTTKGFWGSIAGVMSKWILFFNPTVQGITQILRSRKMHPKRFNALLGAVFGSGLIVPFLNSMVVGMFGGDEEDYWLQNDYNRMNNLLLKNPFESGYFKIPLPPTFREIYGMGDILYRLMTDRITPERAAIATLRQLQLLTGFLNLIPDEEPDLGKALIGLAPDVLAPLTDVILNQDFTGRKIAKVSDYNKHDPEYLRVYKGVSPFYVEVSRYINEMGGDDISRAPLYGTFINPAYMEHVVMGYSGGIGKTLSNVAGIVADAVSGEFYENFDLRKVPIVSRFYSVSDEATVKSAVNRKYRDYQLRYEKLKHDYKKYKAAVSEGELQFADDLLRMDSSGEKEFVNYFGRKQKLLNKKLDRLKKNPDNKALEQEITDLKAEISLKCFELLK